MSANTLVLSAIGLVLGLLENGENLISGIVVVIISVVAASGISLCFAWRKLVRSYTQINRGKFEVIHLIKKHLPAAIFKTEYWIPYIFITLYFVVALILVVNYIEVSGFKIF